MGFQGAGSTVGSPGGYLQGAADVTNAVQYTHAIGVNGLSKFRAMFSRSDVPGSLIIATVEHRVPQRGTTEAWAALDVPVSVPATLDLPVVIEGVIASNAVRVKLEGKTAATTTTVRYEVMVTPF